MKDVIVHRRCQTATSLGAGEALQLRHDPATVQKLWCFRCSDAFPLETFTWADGTAIR